MSDIIKKEWSKEGIKYGYSVTATGCEGLLYNSYGFAEKDGKRVSKANPSWGKFTISAARKQAVKYKKECLEYFTKGIKHWGVE